MRQLSLWSFSQSSTKSWLIGILWVNTRTMCFCQWKQPIVWCVFYFGSFQAFVSSGQTSPESAPLSNFSTGVSLLRSGRTDSRSASTRRLFTIKFTRYFAGAPSCNCSLNYFTWSHGRSKDLSTGVGLDLKGQILKCLGQSVFQLPSFFCVVCKELLPLWRSGPHSLVKSFCAYSMRRCPAITSGHCIGWRATVA